MNNDLERAITELCDYYDKEDRTSRERQLREWRKLKLIWEGFQKVWYDSAAHDWRIYDEANDDLGQSYYDKPINVFRAYLESIIAALSINVPSVKCYPDNADDPLDLSTARTGDKIAELIYRHNNAPLLWLKALFTFVTEGMVACYSYPKEDEDYGTYEEKKYEEVTGENYTCPYCNSEIPEEVFTEKLDEFMPDDESIQTGPICPSCNNGIDPNLEKSSFTITRLVGITNKPKSRICTEVYGGLFVKVPNYAQRQIDCPYLIFSYETHFTNVLERFPQLRDKIHSGSGRGGYDEYETWARLNPQYHNEQPNDTVTVRNTWLRPSSYNYIRDEKIVAQLKEKFPIGIKAVIVNDTFAEAHNESLDDCWTLTEYPLSDYLHHDPLGRQLVSIQDITNNLVSLIVQTIEHGIPQTFADPAVLNFNQYSQSEVTPGGVYQATPRTGKGVSDGFYEVKTATLSQEVMPFLEKIQEFGQLVSGATPSLFGGQLEGSRTASEYSMSRAQALQRQQNSWKVFTIWWKTIFGKIIPMYIKEVKEDERTVERDTLGNFINVFIRKAELEGKIGRIELEASENLPITWGQRKDVIAKLLETQNPQIMEMLAAVENLPMLRESLGLTDLVIPGEDDREREYEIIKQLLNSEPISQPVDPMMIEQARMAGQIIPQVIELPSVPVDEVIDNNDIGAQICRSFLVSQAGRQAKIDNPVGYKNVLLRLKQHMDFIAAEMMQNQMAQAGAGQPNQPKTKGSASPLMENENVSAAQ